MTPQDTAEAIHAAHRAGRTLEADSVRIDEAYDVQERLTALRVAEGDQPRGWKLGYTSAAMRAQMGVDAPNLGPLFASMIVDSGAVVDRFVQPRVEPEIAVEMAVDVDDPDGVAAAVGTVRAALEIVDSVWRDYRFTWAHNTADGSSAAGVVLGPVLDVDPRALDAVAVRLRVDGQEVATATGAAADGHPLRGVAWLVGQLAERGERLRRGDLVITGGLTAAHPLTPGGVVEAVFEDGVAVRVSRARSAPRARAGPPYGS